MLRGFKNWKRIQELKFFSGCWKLKVYFLFQKMLIVLKLVECSMLKLIKHCVCLRLEMKISKLFVQSNIKKFHKICSCISWRNFIYVLKRVNFFSKLFFKWLVNYSSLSNVFNRCQMKIEVKIIEIWNVMECGTKSSLSNYQTEIKESNLPNYHKKLISALTEGKAGIFRLSGLFFRPSPTTSDCLLSVNQAATMNYNF